MSALALAGFLAWIVRRSLRHTGHVHGRTVR